MNADGTRAAWPEADVVVGNPPFLGNKKMIGELGESLHALRCARRGQNCPAASISSLLVRQGLGDDGDGQAEPCRTGSHMPFWSPTFSVTEDRSVELDADAVVPEDAEDDEDDEQPAAASPARVIVRAA